MDFKRFFVFVFLAIAQATNLSFAQDIIPQFKTEEEIINYLIYIRRNIPELFSDAAKYDFDLISILNDEQLLLEKLEKDPNFKELMKYKLSHMKQITLSPPQGEISASTLKPEALESWKRYQKDLLPKSEKDFKQIVVNLKKLIAHPKQMPASLLGGVMASLSRELKIQLDPKFKGRSDDEILKLLGEMLPDPLPPSFDFNHQGFSKLPSKSELLSELNSRFKYQRELEQHLQIATLIDATGAQTLHELNLKLSTLIASDLNYYADIDAISQMLLRNNIVVDKKIIKELAKTATAYTKKIIREGNQITKIKGEMLTLKEIPPGIGIFRGCTGGDCSSKHSFPYPNDPHERIFFIEGQDGKLKGYISATEVEVEGKKSLFINTISGNRVNAADTEMILNGLYKERASLGVEQVVIPNMDNLARLINFNDIRITYQGYANGKKQVAIVYLDREIRSIIENYSSINNRGEYDHMDKNKTGVVFIPNEQIEASMATKSDDIKFITPFDIKPTDAEKFEFMLEMSYSGRDQIASKIAKQIHVNLQEIEELMENDDDLNVNVWEQRLEETFSKHHGTSLLKQDHLFIRGRLHAPDAFSEAHQKKTLKMLEAFLNINFDKLSDLKEIFEKNQKLISTAPGIIEFVKNKLKKVDISNYEATLANAENLMSKENLEAIVLDLIEQGEYDKTLITKAFVSYASFKNNTRWKTVMEKTVDKEINPQFFEEQKVKEHPQVSVTKVKTEVGAKQDPCQKHGPASRIARALRELFNLQ